MLLSPSSLMLKYLLLAMYTGKLSQKYSMHGRAQWSNMIVLQREERVLSSWLMAGTGFDFLLQ